MIRPSAPARLSALALVAALALGAAPQAGHAQGLFAPQAYVNERVVTTFEVEQRSRMLQLFGTQGNVRAQALQGLIDDRLRESAAFAVGIAVTEDAVRAGMEEFASRANLSATEFVTILNRSGVATESFRDFVLAGLLWRELVRTRFLSRAQITDAEIDRALTQASRTDSSGTVVEYAQFFIPEGPNAPAEAARVASRLDSCDDLYGVARGLPEERLLRESRRLAEVPAEIGRELARLDDGEVSTSMVRGGARVVLMLCGRTPVAAEGVDREAIREQLRNQRLASYADGYLEELRADAIIRTP